LANRYRVLPYIFGSLAILVVVVRSWEVYGGSGRAFIRSGLMFDKLCYLGSFEITVCPYTLPPYETFLAILAVLLVLSLWAGWKK
jgi:hypothetical protein